MDGLALDALEPPPVLSGTQDFPFAVNGAEPALTLQGPGSFPSLGL